MTESPKKKKRRKNTYLQKHTKKLYTTAMIRAIKLEKVQKKKI